MAVPTGTRVFEAIDLDMLELVQGGLGQSEPVATGTTTMAASSPSWVGKNNNHLFDPAHQATTEPKTPAHPTDTTSVPTATGSHETVPHGTTPTATPTLPATTTPTGSTPTTATNGNITTVASTDPKVDDGSEPTGPFTDPGQVAAAGATGDPQGLGGAGDPQGLGGAGDLQGLGADPQGLGGGYYLQGLGASDLQALGIV